MTYLSMVISDQAFAVTIPNGASVAYAALTTAVSGAHTIEYSMRTPLTRTDYEPRSAMATLELTAATTITCTRAGLDGDLIIRGRIKQWR